MRFGSASVSLYVLVVGAIAVRAALEPRHFRWRMPLQELAESGALHRAELPMSVLDGCKDFPADLLLIDESGRRWPFFIQEYQQGDPLVSLPFARVDPPANEPAREGIESIYLDLRLKSVPLRRLVVQAADAHFARTVNVFGRNSETNHWLWVAEGDLHRFADGERDWIDLHNRAFRFLRLDLYHLEEPPVTITNLVVWVEPMRVVFEASSAERAWLYFGASAHGLPLFELRHRTSEREVARARHVAFGHREPNPHFFSAELWDYGQLLLAASATVVAVLAAGIALKRLR